jgi:hypothetical protein
MAVASLVCSLVGVAPCPLIIPSIIGLILGIAAKMKINRSAGALRGGGMAMTGIIVGALVIVVYPIIGVMVYRAIDEIVTSNVDTIDSFLQAVDEGNYSHAYNDLTTEEFKSATSYEEFVDWAERYRSSKGSYEGCSFSLMEEDKLEFEASGGQRVARMLLTVKYSKGGTFKMLFALKKVGDKWLIVRADISTFPSGRSD